MSFLYARPLSKPAGIGGEGFALAQVKNKVFISWCKPGCRDMRLVPGALSRAAPQASSEASVVIHIIHQQQVLPSTAAGFSRMRLPAMFLHLSILFVCAHDPARRPALRYPPAPGLSRHMHECQQAENARLAVGSFFSVQAHETVIGTMASIPMKLARSQDGYFHPSSKVIHLSLLCPLHLN